LSQKKIHLIGIGGTGMGALAGLLCEAGHEVRGSDGPLYPPMSTMLQQLGVPLMEGYRPQNLDWGPDLVVVGNICRKDHPEAVAAAERGLRRVSFPQLLGELFLRERRPLVVAGTHGKTTTTSLAAHMLRAAGRDPGFLVGGIPANLGRSYALGAAPHFVIEGDEYDCAFFDKRPKFVHYQPHTVILTGVEFDHADIYSSMQEVERAFSMLVERISPVGLLLVCADSPAAVALSGAARCPVELYSVRGHADATWIGQATPAGSGRQRLAVRRGDVPSVELEVGMTGRHNMENVLAVTAAGLHLGLGPGQVAEAMGAFEGVKRRQEVVGVARGVTVIDDFAHHPTAVRETLAGLRGVHGQGRLVAVLEPRSATSKRNVFQDDFAVALAEADEAVVAALHMPEKVPADERLDVDALVATLSAGGTAASCLPSVDRMVEHLSRTCGEGDTVVVMSSGGFEGLPRRLVEALDAG